MGEAKVLADRDKITPQNPFIFSHGFLELCTKETDMYGFFEQENFEERKE